MRHTKTSTRAEGRLKTPIRPRARRPGEAKPPLDERGGRHDLRGVPTRHRVPSPSSRRDPRLQRLGRARPRFGSRLLGLAATALASAALCSALLGDLGRLLCGGLPSGFRTGFLCSHFDCLPMGGTDLEESFLGYVARRILPPSVMCQRKKCIDARRGTAAKPKQVRSRCGESACLVGSRNAPASRAPRRKTSPARRLDARGPFELAPGPSSGETPGETARA